MAEHAFKRVTPDGAFQFPLTALSPGNPSLGPGPVRWHRNCTFASPDTKSLSGRRGERPWVKPIAVFRRSSSHDNRG